MRVAKMFVVLLAIFSLFGCAAASRMIDYGSMKTDVAMSETIFLSPTDAPKKVLIQVRNTSSNQEASDRLESVIASRIRSKGYEIVNSPKEATYLLQVNLRYLGEYKDGMNFQDTLTMGTAGALTGLGLSSRGDYGRGAAIGGIIGAIGGFALDTATRVRTEIIAIDIQITELLSPGEDLTGQKVLKYQTAMQSGVMGGIGAKQNAPTMTTTFQQVGSTKEGVNVYTAGVAAKAMQVNLNVAEATGRLIEIAGRQIAGIF